MKTVLNWLDSRRDAGGLAAYRDRLVQINALAPGMGDATDGDLRQQAQRLRERVRAGEPLDDVATEVFALVREVADRTVGLRPFDVQLAGGLALHDGKVIQMQTGEGKTLTAIAPAVLHALAGQGIHILTFNDYLARRDAGWMGPIYAFLGLSAGCVQEGMSPTERQTAYRADVTYVTAKEAGFDYLRDGLVVEPDDAVHRPFHMALVDEADSILIDEARVPLVIAGVAEGLSGAPERLAAIAQHLTPGQDYVVNHASQTVHPTEEGMDTVEDLLDSGNLYTPENLPLLTGLNAALYAAALMKRDVDYIVRNGLVEIVDEFTGRVVEGRHWPDGLQAAIEAKEGLHRSQEGQVLGRITLQHFLEQYPRLCGMTATAEVAAGELREVYGLEVQVIPSNRPCIRVDHPDIVFTHKEAKHRALVEEIHRVHATGRPLLAGTLTVAESEQLAAGLRAAGVPCDILNAKRDAKEAQIIAQAGRLGAVTISTNMAGRGTDIRLGGSDGAEQTEVVALGGLYVIGTNRHDSQRVDDQLRGRAGRQGDPGSSRFFISLDDDLLLHQGIDALLPARHRPAHQPDPLDNPVISRVINHAQRIVEGRHAGIRRALWSYSHFIEQQRRFVQRERQRVLTREAPPGSLLEGAPAVYERACEVVGPEAAAELERRLTLQAIDQCWAGHLAAVAEIRDGIHLVTIGGLSPLEEFQKAAATSFMQYWESRGPDSGDLESWLSLWESEEDQSGLVTPDGIDFSAAGLRRPASTWTYLVDEDAFGDPIASALVSRHHTGFAAGAAFTGPLLLLWALVRRFRND